MNKTGALPKTRRTGWPAFLLVSLSPILVVLIAVPAQADVIVLSNRTNAALRVQVQPVLAAAQNIALGAGETVPIFVDGQSYVAFASGRQAKRYLLDANSVYFFGTKGDGRVDMQKIGLGDDKSSAKGRNMPGRASATPSLVVPVKLYVDEEEPALRQHWERRLRSRVEAASAVLEQYCRVQLKVVAVGTWDSDDSTTDFFESLREFEEETKPFPGRLAIGFTSQYQIVQGRVHFAGTRGALHSHILVREWGQHMSEPERLELLVHELGHYLGAAHSPEQDSVMRPVLGNRQAVRVDFHVRFDPVNTLIIAMVAEELRRRKIQQLSQMSEGTKKRLRQIYGALGPTLPQDPAAQQVLQRLNSPRR